MNLQDDGAYPFDEKKVGAFTSFVVKEMIASMDWLREDNEEINKEQLDETLDIFVRKVLDVCFECLNLETLTSDGVYAELKRIRSLLETLVENHVALQKLCEDETLKQLDLFNYSSEIVTLKERLKFITEHIDNRDNVKQNDVLGIVGEDVLFKEMFSRIKVPDFSFVNAQKDSKKRKADALE